MKFLRIDRDSSPDTQSYYDTRGYDHENNWRSSFRTKEMAIDLLGMTYGDRFVDYIRSHLVKTDKGWGLPVGQGFLFGECVDRTKPPAWHVFGVLVYYAPNKYLQVYEGIWVDENSPMRKEGTWDGDLFLPQQLLHSWQIPSLDVFDPEDKVGYRQWIQWLDSDLNQPPWEWIKQSASLKQCLNQYYKRKLA